MDILKIWSDYQKNKIIPPNPTDLSPPLQVREVEPRGQHLLDDLLLGAEGVVALAAAVAVHVLVPHG